MKLVSAQRIVLLPRPVSSILRHVTSPGSGPMPGAAGVDAVLGAHVEALLVDAGELRDRAHLPAVHPLADRALDVRPRGAEVDRAEHAVGAGRVVDVRPLVVGERAQRDAGDAVAGERPARAEVRGDVDAALGGRVDQAVLVGADAPHALGARHAVVRGRRRPGRAAVGGLVDAAAGHAREHLARDEAGEHGLHGLVELLRVLRVDLRTLRDRLERAAALGLEQARGRARVDRRPAREHRAHVHRAGDRVQPAAERAPGEAVVRRAVDAVALGRRVHASASAGTVVYSRTQPAACRPGSPSQSARAGAAPNVSSVNTARSVRRGRWRMAGEATGGLTARVWRATGGRLGIQPPRLGAGNRLRDPR